MICIVKEHIIATDAIILTIWYLKLNTTSEKLKCNINVDKTKHITVQKNKYIYNGKSLNNVHWNDMQILNLTLVTKNNLTNTDS